MIEDRAPKPHALIVGASSGLGHLVAERLVKTHRVTAIARRIDRLATLEAAGASIFQCDVSDLESIPTIVDTAVETHGKIDCLIYCAGTQMIKPMRALKTSDIEMIVTVNLTAALVFARLMASQRISSIDSVFCAVSSIAAQRPEPGIIPYAVTKAGIEAMVKGLARELAPRRAVGIAPGWLETEMTEAYKQIYNDTFKADLEKRAPRGIATTAAVADLIEFLISPKASYITGQIVTIDGGASL